MNIKLMSQYEPQTVNIQGVFGFCSLRTFCVWQVIQLSMIGLEFATNNPESKKQLDKTLTFFDTCLGPVYGSLLFVTAWTAVKMLCVDAFVRKGNNGLRDVRISDMCVSWKWIVSK